MWRLPDYPQFTGRSYRNLQKNMGFSNIRTALRRLSVGNTRRISIVGVYGVTMSDSFVITCLLTVLALLSVLLWRTLVLSLKLDALTDVMTEESTTVQTGLRSVGSLLEEGLDMVNELLSGPPKPSAAVQAMSESIPQMILGALMNKMQMSPEHGSEQEEREVQQEHPSTQTEEEI